MIAYIKGKILAKKGDFLIVEQQGIGYKIFVSKKTQTKLKKGQEKEFFTHFCVRNERPELYGFLRMDELEIFELIEKISGIGPKGALLIASLGAIDELKKAYSFDCLQDFLDIYYQGASVLINENDFYS